MGTLIDALDQPFPAGRAWAEGALGRLGLHPHADLSVRHVAQGWMRLGIGEEAVLVDTLFVLTESHLGFGQTQVETTDPHWVPLSSIVAVDLIEGLPQPLDAIEVQFNGGLAIFVGWPESLSMAVVSQLQPLHATVETFVADVPEMPLAPIASLFGPSDELFDAGEEHDDADPPSPEAEVAFPFSPDDRFTGVGQARPEVADEFFADIDHSDDSPALFSVGDKEGLGDDIPQVPEPSGMISGPWDDPAIGWPDALRNCVFLGGHPVHQRRRKNVTVMMRPGGLVIGSGGHGWSVHVGWHEVRRLDVQSPDEVKFTHNHRIDHNGSALVVELADGTSLVVEVRGRRPATLRSGLAPVIAVAAAPATSDRH